MIEKGWGDAAAANDTDAVLNREEEKTWQVIRDVAPDMRVFDVLSYPKLYHNLKAAIKEVCTEVKNPHIFYDDCAIPGEEMMKIVESKDFARLPVICQALRRRPLRHCFTRETVSSVIS